jgi:uncharacterized protein (DUF58 family)
MSAVATAKLGGYAALAALALVAGIVLERPELVAVAGPFALFLALGLTSARTPSIRVGSTVSPERVTQGDATELEIEVGATSAISRLDVHLALPRGTEPRPGWRSVAIAAGTGEPRRLNVPLRCSRIGVQQVEPVVARARDRFGLLTTDARQHRGPTIRVYPQPQPLRSPVTAAETQLYSGNEVSRARGEGIEFAELRPLAPGESHDRVNWRVTARRGSEYVTDRHPERNVAVVLFLDAFADAADETGAGTLEMSITAAAALARMHLFRRDRVGLVHFGAWLEWLQPRMGLGQLPPLVDAVLKTRIAFSYAWKDIRSIPRGVIPAQALVIALTPLLDERFVAALFDLRARGFDLAVLEMTPMPFLPAASDEFAALARRLWELKRGRLRGRLRELGVAVAVWSPDDPLERAIAEVNQFKRWQRHAYA